MGSSVCQDGKEREIKGTQWKPGINKRWDFCDFTRLYIKRRLLTVTTLRRCPLKVTVWKDVKKRQESKLQHQSGADPPVARLPVSNSAQFILLKASFSVPWASNQIPAAITWIFSQLRLVYLPSSHWEQASAAGWGSSTHRHLHSFINHMS